MAFFTEDKGLVMQNTPPEPVRNEDLLSGFARLTEESASELDAALLVARVIDDHLDTEQTRTRVLKLAEAARADGVDDVKKYTLQGCLDHMETILAEAESRYASTNDDRIRPTVDWYNHIIGAWARSDLGDALKKTHQFLHGMEQYEEINNDTDAEIIDNSVEDAIVLYRKVREGKNKELTEKEIANIEKECEIIRNREVIIRDSQHKPVEITNKDGLVVTGPPTLTRFEKARIMGARALQLSLGAPIFIEIPKNATTSLEIAMEELKQRVIPIVIKRTLPNGDYQNIPIDQFA